MLCCSLQCLLVRYEVGELAQYGDYFNLMTFDLHGQWENAIGHNSPLHPIESASPAMKKLTVSHAANVWVTEGAPAEKILIGIPTYARTFTLENVDKFDIGATANGGGAEGGWTKEVGFLAYYEVSQDREKNERRSPPAEGRHF